MRKYLLSLCLLLCCLLLPVQASAEPAVPEDFAVLASDDWIFGVSNGVAGIAKYTGTDAQVVVPDSTEINGMSYRLRSIGDEAFRNNPYVQEVMIPEGIYTVGNRAFDNCSALTDVTISSTVTKLGDCAFRNCINLAAVTIEGDLADCSRNSGNASYSSAYSVFYNTGTNADGFEVFFGSAVTRIPAYLFATAYSMPNNVYCHLMSVSVPNGVREIGEGAFLNCFGLESLDLGGVLDIGPYAFAGDAALSEISLPDGLNAIGGNAFASCTLLREIVIPASVTKLGDCAFKNCTNLSYVDIEGNLADCSRNSENLYDSESSSVFYNTGTNVDVFEVIFGPDVTRIPADLFATGDRQGDHVFCCHITSVLIPSSVREIGRAAFYNCHDLADVQYSGDWTAWSQIVIGEYNDSITDENKLHASGPPAPIPQPHPAVDACRIDRVEVRSTAGEILSYIPSGSFLASVTFTKDAEAGDPVLLLASYSASGQYQGLLYVKTKNVPVGSTLELTVPVQNAYGTVAQLKAFLVSSVGDLMPLGSSVSYPSR